MKVDNFFEEVVIELAKAINHNGPMHSGHEAYAVIKEELDEFWDDVKIRLPNKIEDQIILRRNMKKELIQVATMCCQAIIDLNLDEE